MKWTAEALTFEKLTYILKQVSLLDLSECTFETGVDDDGEDMWINAITNGSVTDAICYNGNIFLMMDNGGSFHPLNPMASAFKAWYESPTPHVGQEDWKEKYELLSTLINNPEIENFINGVTLEAAHQTQRWGAEKEEKEPPHHYILVTNKLLGKMCVDIWDRDTDKFKHHIIALAAEMFNIHRQVGKDGTVINKYFKKTILK